jgi:3-hydroxyisobutyrate dehydrogenase-like beta-hydroxyacid dehydrogenase
MIGVIGTGRMGLALGERILAAGFRLTVHNRTPERRSHCWISARCGRSDRPM